MEEVSSSMGQAQMAFSSSPVVLEDSITSSVPDIQTEVVLEESKEIISNNSIICIDDDDDDDYDLPELPVFYPIQTKTDKEPSKDEKDSNDDDFSIVYEKIVPPLEIQIVQNYQIEHSCRSSVNKGRKTHRLPTNSDSRQTVTRETISEVSQESSLDDSITIINDECTTSHSISTKLNSLKQSVIDSAEKKKRKIECAVCFDGPDEIYNSRRNLVSTICGHIFCDECLKHAITTSKKCPQCRKKLTAKQYHPIYL